MNLKSLEDFKVAAEGTGNDVVYWYWYGNSAFFLDRPEEATRAYERCTEVDKSYRDCWCNCRFFMLAQAKENWLNKPAKSVKPNRFWVGNNLERECNSLPLFSFV